MKKQLKGRIIWPTLMCILVRLVELSASFLFMTILNLVKEKDFEVLADAVRRENQRLQAYQSQIR